MPFCKTTVDPPKRESQVPLLVNSFKLQLIQKTSLKESRFVKFKEAVAVVCVCSNVRITESTMRNTNDERWAHFLEPFKAGSAPLRLELAQHLSAFFNDTFIADAEGCMAFSQVMCALHAHWKERGLPEAGPCAPNVDDIIKLLTYEFGVVRNIHNELPRWRCAFKDEQRTPMPCSLCRQPWRQIRQIRWSDIPPPSKSTQSDMLSPIECKFI